MQATSGKYLKLKHLLKLMDQRLDEAVQYTPGSQDQRVMLQSFRGTAALFNDEIRSVE